MATAQNDRIYGLTGNIAVKAACKVATTANITLSGLQTIDGVALSAGIPGLVAPDRVFVKNQTDTTTNGIYDCNSGAWTRSPDFDGNRDVIKGTIVYVTDGATLTNLYFYKCTSTDSPIIIGTSALTFTAVAGSGIGTLAAQNSNNVTITGGTISGINLASISGTTISGATISSSTTGDLKFTGNILDTNSNELLKFTTVASAVNEVTISNAATGTSPTISVTGNNTDIALMFQMKGAGGYTLNGTSTSPAYLRIYEQTTNGTNFVALRAPATLAADISFILPTALPVSVTQFLQSDTSGNMSFATPVFSKSFTSTDQSITFGTALPLAHSLSAVPKIVNIYLVNQTTEGGYSPGDIIQIVPYADSSSSVSVNAGLALYSDSTNITYRFSSNGYVYVHKTTGSDFGITAANWKVRAVAYA